MITLQQHEAIIQLLKSLSEIELAAIIKDLNEHSIKNDMHHLFVDKDIDELESEIEEKDHELLNLTFSKDRLVDQLYSIKDSLERFYDRMKNGECTLDELQKIIHWMNFRK